MSPEAPQAVEMRITDVRRVWIEDVPQYWVTLQEVGGTRSLPIWIGRSEGDSLALGLQHVQPPRPLTYALAANLVRAAGARVREVTVSRLVDTTFYATVVLEAPEGTKAVDARPSDALNLALTTGAPIRVEPAVLEAADRHRSSLPPEKVQGAAEIVTEIMANWSKHTAQPK